MSDHAHDSHGHDDHSHGAQDDHGHAADAHAGDEHEHGHWGDYNAKPPAPSTLPPLSTVQLSILGVALAVLLGAILGFSLRLPDARVHDDEAHGGAHGSPDEKAHGAVEKPHGSHK